MARTTFFVDDPMTRNGVLVLSRAPLETILVRTNDVTGEIEVDPANVTDHPRVTLEVPVASLDTGIPLMNDVMASDRWLDAAKHPSIRFSLTRVTAPSRARFIDNETISIAAEGTLDLHGVPQTVPVRADVTWLKQSEKTARRLPGDVVHVAAAFVVQLHVFGIESHMAATALDKVAGNLQVEVDVFASTERPQVPADMQQRLKDARAKLGQRLLA